MRTNVIELALFIQRMGLIGFDSKHWLQEDPRAPMKFTITESCPGLPDNAWDDKGTSSPTPVQSSTATRIAKSVVQAHITQTGLIPFVGYVRLLDQLGGLCFL
jgi:hypothetical protein